MPPFDDILRDNNRRQTESDFDVGQFRIYCPPSQLRMSGLPVKEAICRRPYSYNSHARVRSLRRSGPKKQGQNNHPYDSPDNPGNVRVGSLPFQDVFMKPDFGHGLLVLRFIHVNLFKEDALESALEPIPA
jgi:hypothetical protein